jgi:hypothetical protein
MEMNAEVRAYETWAKERAQAEAWAQRVQYALPPYERERPRDTLEAHLLRERGNPERLIGPSADR